MFIISYIYYKAMVIESLVCYKVIDLVKSYVYYEFIKLCFITVIIEDIY